MADQKTPASASREPAKKTPQEDEVVGKAYDGRLMRRLLTYLRPYRLQVVLSALAILFKAATDVMGPYLVKVAVDTYMTGTSRPSSPGWHGTSIVHPSRGSLSSPCSISARSSSPSASNSSRPT